MYKNKLWLIYLFDFPSVAIANQERNIGSIAKRRLFSVVLLNQTSDLTRDMLYGGGG